MKNSVFVVFDFIIISSVPYFKFWVVNYVSISGYLIQYITYQRRIFGNPLHYFVVDITIILSIFFRFSGGILLATFNLLSFEVDLHFAIFYHFFLNFKILLLVTGQGKELLCVSFAQLLHPCDLRERTSFIYTVVYILFLSLGKSREKSHFPSFLEKENLGKFSLFSLTERENLDKIFLPNLTERENLFDFFLFL